MPHIHEKIDFTADVFIVYEQRVLLRLHDKFPIWLAVGGHIELNEDPTQAAIREAKEEVGLDITLVGELPPISIPDGEKELLIPRFMNIHEIQTKPGHRHIALYYFGRSNSDEVRPSGGDISNKWKWFSREDLARNSEGVSERIRFYALRALETLA